MKSKKTTWLLLILSVVIWGTAGWKVYKAFDTGAEQPVVRKIAKAVEKDSISLLLNYRDPFLGNYSDVTVLPDPKPIKKSPVTSTVKPLQQPSVSPDVLFKGTLNVGKTCMAIIQKNNETLTVKAGDKVGDFKITAISDSQIILSKDGKKYEISVQ